MNAARGRHWATRFERNEGEETWLPSFVVNRKGDGDFTRAAIGRREVFNSIWMIRFSLNPGPLGGPGGGVPTLVDISTLLFF